MHYRGGVPVWTVALASGLAAAAAAGLSNSFDVVKTQLQVSKDATVLGILAKDGLSVLWTGSLARVVWAVAESLLTFPFYEALKVF